MGILEKSVSVYADASSPVDTLLRNATDGIDYFYHPTISMPSDIEPYVPAYKIARRTPGPKSGGMATEASHNLSTGASNRR
jgi:hypothetical protein